MTKANISHTYAGRGRRGELAMSWSQQKKAESAGDTSTVLRQDKAWPGSMQRSTKIAADNDTRMHIEHASV